MKLSIITVCLNNKEGLSKTIKSVLSQVSNAYELIVIDGGSTDGSKDILEQYSSKINYWISEPDRGIYNAMNKGIKVATGEYCIFMNSGDVFFDKNVVAKFFRQNPKEDILCGDIAFNIGSKIIKFIEAPRQVNVMYFMSASLPHQSTFIRKTLLEQFPYNESYKIVSDFIFFFDVLILKDASYKKLDFFVANADMGGISNSQLALLFKEKNEYFNNFLPPKLTAELQSYAWDYKSFWGLPKQNFTYKSFVIGRKLFFFSFSILNKIRNRIKLMQIKAKH